jgi:hypothetical protein
MLETVTWPLSSNTSFSSHQRLSEARWHNIKYDPKEAVFAHMSMELPRLKVTPCVKADVGVKDKMKNIQHKKAHHKEQHFLITAKRRSLLRTNKKLRYCFTRVTAIVVCQFIAQWFG